MMSAELTCVELATILKTKVEDSVKKMSGHGGARQPQHIWYPLPSDVYWDAHIKFLCARYTLPGASQKAVDGGQVGLFYKITKSMSDFYYLVAQGCHQPILGPET